MHSPEKNYKVDLSADEIRYIVSSGFALIQFVPEKSLQAYSGFNKEEILLISSRMRNILDSYGLDM
ncbi:hypothetical protein CQ054_10555 [Ochrobactrum sp. MYb29]|nr:hypothetical protein CQ054_10555 [Ochrobactrum sp. MYb29]